MSSQDDEADNYFSYNTPSSFHSSLAMSGLNHQPQKHESGFGKHQNLDIYNREKEMKEIDLKLKSLQLLIKNNIS